MCVNVWKTFAICCFVSLHAFLQFYISLSESKKTLISLYLCWLCTLSLKPLIGFCESICEDIFSPISGNDLVTWHPHPGRFHNYKSLEDSALPGCLIGYEFSNGILSECFYDMQFCLIDGMDLRKFLIDFFKDFCVNSIPAKELLNYWLYSYFHFPSKIECLCIAIWNTRNAWSEENG